MTRDLDTLRQRLQDHRDVLAELEADAPSQALAERYATLRTWIEGTISNLDSAPPVAPPRAAAPVPAVAEPEPELIHSGEPGAWDRDENARTGADRGRMFAVVILGIAAFALLGFLFVRFFSDRDAAAPVSQIREIEAVDTADEGPLDEPVIIEEEQDPIASAPPAAAPERVVPRPSAAETTSGPLTVDPELATADGFGSGKVIRQFRIENPTPNPVRITVERSSCRCLWYDVAPEIPAGGGVVLEVTVDGSRLEGDRLDETIGVLQASDRGRLAEFRLTGSR